MIPDGGENFTLGPEGSYIGSLMKCTVEVLDVFPSDRQLINLTNQVVDNNFRFSRPDEPEFDARLNNPVPLYPGKKNTPIKYLVLVSKENRTYDEVFGQIEKGNGDPSL